MSSCSALLLLAACSLPGNARPIVKLGLIAPFEGAQRALGYAVLPAVKLAVEDAVAAGDVGDYRVLVVVLNDDGDPATAARQADALAVDGEIVGAIGPWSTDTAEQAAPLLDRAGIPTLVAAPLTVTAPTLLPLCPSPVELESRIRAEARRSPSSDMPLVGGPELPRPWFEATAGEGAEGARALVCSPIIHPPASFPDAYQARTGSAPGPDALLAYGAARTLLTALGREAQEGRPPSRGSVGAALTDLNLRPSAGWLVFRNGRWNAE